MFCRGGNGQPRHVFTLLNADTQLEVWFCFLRGLSTWNTDNDFLCKLHYKFLYVYDRGQEVKERCVSAIITEE